MVQRSPRKPFALNESEWFLIAIICALMLIDGAVLVSRHPELFN